MRGPKPPSIALTARQRDLLERLVRRPSTPQHRVRRAQVILRAADGQTNSHIAAALGLDRTQVGLWRTRWAAAAARLAATEAAHPDGPALSHALDALLADAPRPGTPPTFSPEQIVQIVALACEPPADSGRPISHWTPHELAAEAVQRQIVPRISARSVGRFLK